MEAGQLLVAVPGMFDPTFGSTVVYLFGFENGAAGVVLNRPSDLLVRDALPDLMGYVAPPEVVFFGGPVQTDLAIVLGETDGVPHVIPDHDAISAGEQIRVFAGYSGWGPGQLEAEIDAGGWFVLAATGGDVLDPAPENLWRRVFARQADGLKRYRAYPDNPSLN